MTKTKTPFWRNPRLRYGSVSTLLLCLALAVLIALNALFTALENKHGWRVDCSFNSLTTYSDQTAEILAQVDEPVVRLTETPTKLTGVSTRKRCVEGQ